MIRRSRASEMACSSGPVRRSFSRRIRKRPDMSGRRSRRYARPRVTHARLPNVWSELGGRRLAPLYLRDAFHLSDGFHHLAEMRQIVHFDEDGPKDRPIFGVQIGSANVGAGLADGLHDVGIETPSVFPADC